MTSIRASSFATAAAGSTANVAVPTGTAAGDKLLVLIGINNNQNISDNNGANAFTVDSNVNQLQLSTLGETVSLYVKDVTSGDLTAWAGNLSFNVSGATRLTAIAIAVQDPAATFYDVVPANTRQDSATSSATAPSITTTTANAIHVALVVVDGNTTTISSTPLGYIVDQNGGNQAAAVVHKPIASAGSTGSQSFGLGTSQGWIAVSFAIAVNAGSVASDGIPIPVQIRAPGFPPLAPIPGIPRLGYGILQAPPPPTFSAAGSAASSSFAVAASGLLTFSATGSAAESPFTTIGDGLTTGAPSFWSIHQPLTLGYPARSPAPPPSQLGSGIFGPSPAAPATSFTCTGSADLSQFAATATGSLTFAATGSAAISSFAAASSGAETFAATGSAAISPLACTGSGAEAFSGTASCAISPFAVSSSGTEAFACSGSAATSPFAVNGTSAETFTGTANSTCSSFAADGSGSESFIGSGTATASSFAASALGAFAIVPTFWFSQQPFARGYPAATIVRPPPRLGAGIFVYSPAVVPNAAAADVSTFASSGSGFITFAAASGSAATAQFAASATGSESLSGAATATVSPCAVAASGAETFTASGNATCSSFAISGAGAEAFACSGTAAIAPFACSGNGATGAAFFGSASGALSAFADSGTGSEVFLGIVTATPSAFAVAAAGAEAFAGSGSFVLSLFASAGVGFTGSFIGVGAASLAAFGTNGFGFVPLAITSVKTTVFLQIQGPTSRFT